MRQRGPYLEGYIRVHTWRRWRNEPGMYLGHCIPGRRHDKCEFCGTEAELAYLRSGMDAVGEEDWRWRQRCNSSRGCRSCMAFRATMRPSDSTVSEIRSHRKVWHREVTQSELSFKRTTLAVGLRRDSRGGGQQRSELLAGKSQMAWIRVVAMEVERSGWILNMFWR